LGFRGLGFRGLGFKLKSKPYPQPQVILGMNDLIIETSLTSEQRLFAEQARFPTRTSG